MPDVHMYNVSFSYAGSSNLVLRSINLTISEGEFVLLAGPSGCGKSTLALAMAGLIPSRIAGYLRGGIYLGERNVSAMDIHEVSRNIGMVFQNPEEQLIHLDVEAEVAFGPENLALPQLEIERRVAESLKYTGMERLRTYEPRQSLIHTLDPRLKVLYPFVIGILSVLLNWDFVFLLFGFTLIPWLLVRTSPARMRVVITMIVTPAIGLIWSQGLFHIQDYAHPDLIFPFPWTISWFGTPGLSASGLLYGVQQAGRVMAGAAASLILLMTTKPSEVIWAFYKFRMSAAVGLAFTAALRFLPQMIERMTVLLQVMQVRGYDLTIPRWWEVPKWPGYIARVFMCIPIVTVPLLISSLRSTSVMAMVADARAFGSHTRRTMLREHQTTLADRIALGVMVALIITVVVLLSLHIGNRQV